jgi:hypothetical protein
MISQIICQPRRSGLGSTDAYKVYFKRIFHWPIQKIKNIS